MTPCEKCGKKKDRRGKARVCQSCADNHARMVEALSKLRPPPDDMEQHVMLQTLDVIRSEKAQAQIQAGLQGTPVVEQDP